MASEYVDVLQIPAFLARQTELLVAAAKTGKTVNIKKGQFMSPDSMEFAVNKVKESGNDNVMITERGTQFGYNDLIVDFRSIPKMKKIATTILDVTHSVQKPNQTSGVTGGNPEYIESLARAGIVNNVDGIFIETHIDPSKSKSDGANMLSIDKLENLLKNLIELRSISSKL
jgi:2-dehydro-3-deoxyphosphooctonate aldolase (KDO 8-P synthase)